MDIPDTVRIGPFDYKVLRPKSLDKGDSWGLFDANGASISIVAKLPTKVHGHETFLHEVFHAIWYHAALGKKCEEEKAVSQLAYGLASFCRNNPWFLDWLKDA